MGGGEYLQEEVVIYLCRGNHSLSCEGELCLGRRLADSGIKPERRCRLYQIALSNGNFVAKERWEQIQW